MWIVAGLEVHRLEVGEMLAVQRPEVDSTIGDQRSRRPICTGCSELSHCGMGCSLSLKGSHDSGSEKALSQVVKRRNRLPPSRFSVCLGIRTDSQGGTLLYRTGSASNQT
jgi:hypothetical protein